MRDAPNVRLRRKNLADQIPQKVLVHETAGRWSWKSKSAKECVTTHLPNEPALKMDSAQARCRYQTVKQVSVERVGGRGGCIEGFSRKTQLEQL